MFDLPPVTIQVTEYQAEIKDCPCCGRVVKAPFPGDVTQPVQYGVRIRALVGYFSQYQLLPYQRIQELFQDVLNLSISQGSINNILTQGYDKLGGFEAQVKAHLLSSGVVHFDETGLKVNHKKHWLHAASTAKLTCYLIHPRRGLEAMQAAEILLHFTGRAVHDHWLAYYDYACEHALCNAHHLRELTYAQERFKQRWAARLQDCLLEAKAEVDQAKQQGR